MLKIKQVKKQEEFQQIRKLFAEYADSLEFDLDFQGFNEELANLPGDYAPPDGCILLAKYDGKIAGCVALRRLSDDICEGKRLYVRPEFRGLKIGRRLTEAIIAEARKIGYTRIRGDTVPFMQVAIALYESLGFKEIAPYRYNPIEGATFIELEL